MEFSINGKQAIAIVWTIVAIVIALIIVWAMGSPTGQFGGLFFAPWEWLVALFFGLVLIITVPVYLLLVLWSFVSRSDNV